MLIGGFATLTAIGASVKIPFLPYHPNSPQLIAVLLSGAVLGSTRGPLSQILFIFLGILGVPLFLNLAPAVPVPALSSSPLFTQIGLKSGWLLGFVAASYLVGKTLEYAKRSDALTLLISVTGGLVLVYATGIGFPVLVLKAPLGAGFLDWVWPFMLADALKALLVFGFLVNLGRAIKQLPIITEA